MSAWTAWHGGYLDPRSSISRRLRVIQAEIDTWLDLTSPRPVTVLSVCAGDARDLLGVLSDRHDAERVTATLVELDPSLAEEARSAAAASGLTGVTVLRADAGDPAIYANVPRADLVLLCGVLGNIDDGDVERTVAAVRTWCADGARVIWTRARREPDLTPTIRTWFDDNGFEDVAYHTIPDSIAAVGVTELVTTDKPGPPTRARPAPSRTATRIFRFGSSSTNERTVAAYEAKAELYRQSLSDEWPSWMVELHDEVAARLPPGAAVLEIGSATGAAVRVFRERGIRVQPTDVTDAFLRMMRGDGLDPWRLDILHDEITGSWDAILALAVFLHFRREELGPVLERVRRGLAPGGLLSFTVKDGDGESWSDHKLGLPRWFTYWRADALRPFLERRGWDVESLEHRAGARDDWLVVIARPTGPGVASG
ncbi:class I SAM-dependent methyltransferase [Lapillicoccus sp.]|uniref:class I SAM-dependent methyltransferase n=1 Tax=Lapillicoccus sp. TaxID=1909287 RepID=UPI0032657560